MSTINMLLITICVLSCIENQFATSYVTSTSYKWNQIGLRAQRQGMYMQIDSNTEKVNNPNLITDNFNKIRSRILPALLLSTLAFGFSDIALPGKNSVLYNIPS